MPLTGDASTRRYIRLTRQGGKAMLMDQPQGAETPAAPLIIQHWPWAKVGPKPTATGAKSAQPGGELKFKESDRINGTAERLQSLGAQVSTGNDSIIITPARCTAAPSTRPTITARP